MSGPRAEHTRLARMGLRPPWVGVLDFVTRMPGGSTPEEFERRGTR